MNRFSWNCGRSQINFATNLESKDSDTVMSEVNISNTSESCSVTNEESISLLTEEQSPCPQDAVASSIPVCDSCNCNMMDEKSQDTTAMNYMDTEDCDSKATVHQPLPHFPNSSDVTHSFTTNNLSFSPHDFHSSHKLAFCKDSVTTSQAINVENNEIVNKDMVNTMECETTKDPLSNADTPRELIQSCEDCRPGSHNVSISQDNLSKESLPLTQEESIDEKDNSFLSDMETISTTSQQTESKSRETATTSNTSADGRWTQEEHEAFLEGLQVFGREWKKVASKIPTRTSSQIRSHAQKYFAKLARDEQQRHAAIEAAIHESASIIPDHADMSMPRSDPSPDNLTPSALAMVGRILEDPESVQREVEERLNRLRTRYRELQIAIEQRRLGEQRVHQGNDRVNQERPQVNGPSVGHDRTQNDSQHQHPSTTQFSAQTNGVVVIPESSPLETLHQPPQPSLPVHHPEEYRQHLYNAAMFVRRKRPFLDTMSRSLQHRSHRSQPRETESQAVSFQSSRVPHPSSPDDNRSLGNEELIALHVLGGALRHSSSKEDLAQVTSSEPNAMSEIDTTRNMSQNHPLEEPSSSIEVHSLSSNVGSSRVAASAGTRARSDDVTIQDSMCATTRIIIRKERRLSDDSRDK